MAQVKIPGYDGGADRDFGRRQPIPPSGLEPMRPPRAAPGPRKQGLGTVARTGTAAEIRTVCISAMLTPSEAEALRAAVASVPERISVSLYVAQAIAVAVAASRATVVRTAADGR